MNETTTVDDQYPHDEIATMQRCALGLEWLSDLKETIQTQGVSRVDVTAVGDIGRGVGLESFETPESLTALGLAPNAYMPDRAHINVGVATEGIGKTIVDMIKRFFRALMDYLRKFIRWIRKLYMDEGVLRVEIQRAVNAVAVMEKGWDKYVGILKPDDRYEAERAKRRLDVLSGKVSEIPVKQTQLFAIAMMGSSFKRTPYQIENISKTIDELLERLKDLVNNLDDYIEGKEELSMVGSFHYISWSLGVRNKENSDLRFEELYEHFVDLERPRTTNPPFLTTIDAVTEAFDERLGSNVKASVVPYYYMVDKYEQLHDHLRKVERKDISDANVDAKALAERIKYITTITDNIGNVGTVIFRYNRQVREALQVRQKVGRAELVDYKAAVFRQKVDENITERFRQAEKWVVDQLKSVLR